MDDLNFSIWNRGSEAQKQLNDLLLGFKGLHPHTSIILEAPPINLAWAEMLKTALHHQGADLSEVGSTWVNSLASMNSLRPFTPAEINTLGGETAFMPTAWRSTAIPGDAHVYSIPWQLDTRAIFYRRDLLLKSNIDEVTAFSSIDQFIKTLSILRQQGDIYPFTLATDQSYELAQQLAIFIWGTGGNLITSDGHQVSFTLPSASTGVLTYFSLIQFLRGYAGQLPTEASDNLFLQGKAAVTLSGQWVYTTAQIPGACPEIVKSNLGVAMVPGVPFVGGTNLVVWKHTLKDRLAVDLVTYLTSPELQTIYTPGTLPARREALALSRFANDPNFQVIIQSLNRGRTFPNLPLWSLVEDRLCAGLRQVWTDLFNNPSADLDETMMRTLGPVAQRLNLRLGT